MVGQLHMTQPKPSEQYLYLERPHRKKEVAFLMSMKMIFESSPKCFFWTLTPAWPMGDNAFARAVNRFCKKWQNHMREAHGLEKAGGHGDFEAIRVFEPFKSGFLQCHFVCNQRLPVREVRRIAEGTGIGIVDVRVCNPGVAGYLCKYLRKEHALNGIRTWAKWGNWQHVQINNIEVDSFESRLMKWCRIEAAYELRSTMSMTTGQINRVFIKKSKSQAFVDARVLFNNKMVQWLKNRPVKMLVERDGQFFNENKVDMCQRICSSRVY